MFALGKAPAGEIYVKSAGKYLPINISTDYVTRSFRADVKEGLVFYRKVVAGDAKPDDKKESYAPFVQCAPDGGSARQLVIMMPTGSGGWSAIAKSDNEGAFPAGTRLVLNLSSQFVEMDFGGTKLQVKPKQSGLLRSAKTAPDGYASIRIARRATAGEPVIFMSSAWRQLEKERKLLLIYPTPGSTDALSVSAIPDIVESKDEDEKKAESGRK